MTICSLSKKLTSAYLHQIAQDIMLLLIKSLHEKRIREGQDGKKNW